MEQSYTYQTTHLTAEILVTDYCERFVDVPRFLALCRACSNYDKVWSCPSFAFSVDELWKGLCLSYSHMRLLGRKLTFGPEALEKRYDRRQMEELYKATLYRERTDMDSELFALEAENPGSLALLPGFCCRCGEGNCTRAAGQPCRDPQHLRHSLEALGGDVGRTAAELLATPLLWSQEGRLPEYFTLVAALLLPDLS